jgi:hypothetical protein
MLGNTDVIVTRVQRWPRPATVLGPFCFRCVDAETETEITRRRSCTVVESVSGLFKF